LRSTLLALALAGAPVANVANVATIVVSAQGGRQATPSPGAPAPPSAQAPAPAPPEGTVTVGEIQRMFDSYALMQAEQQLQITEDQFAQFLTRFRSLQEARRRGLVERGRYLNELRRLLNAPQVDEGAMREQMKALDEADARTQAELRKAYEAINQVLDVRQQARFRVFEENMERRKLELVTKARQAGRGKP
jgi:Spy/CpxP family protein refolding chaperone